MSATLDIECQKLLRGLRRRQGAGAPPPSTCSTLSTHWTITTRPGGVLRAAPRGNVKGDVLVFMPGQEEIASCVAMLEERLTTLWSCPCTRRSPKKSSSRPPGPKRQAQVHRFDDDRRDECDGAGRPARVDPGWAKNRGCGAGGFEALRVEATSKAQAGNERAARAAGARAVLPLVSRGRLGLAARRDGARDFEM